MALVLAFGCDPDPAAEEPIDLTARSLVGTVDGTDVALGMLLDGDSLAVYACGGDQTFDTHTQWFRGTIGTDDGPNEFELVTQGFTLVGTRTADGLEGEWIDPDGTRYAFAVDPVPDDSDAGVYLGDHPGGNAGVIVQDDGGTLTAQGASCNGAPRQCFQVIILAPLAITDDVIAVEVDVEGTVEQFDVTRTLADPQAG